VARPAASSTSASRTAKAKEVGGIVPHITLKSIANDEPPEQEVLVDRPEKIDSIIRVTGPFAVEATIPTPWTGKVTASKTPAASRPRTTARSSPESGAISEKLVHGALKEADAKSFTRTCM
jgi:hypothetical protein